MELYEESKIKFFVDNIVHLKEIYDEYKDISKGIKNPIKRFLFNRKSLSKFKEYLNKLKITILNKELNIDFLFIFALTCEMCNITVYIDEERDVFNELTKFSCTFTDNNKDRLFVMLLYPKRKEIRFAKYNEENTGLIQYPRHVFIEIVSKETAVYEYDEEMINFIRNYILETYLNYLGDDLKCLI